MATPQEKFQAIYQGRDFYVPDFDIKIRGIDLPKETARDVIEVRYMDSIGRIDTFEITVNNWDAQNLDFKYIGLKKGGDDKRSHIFEPGQVIELWMGYFKPKKDKPESLRLILAGTINKLAPMFPAAGQPTLKVSGQSVLSKLITKQETHNYKPGLTASEIVKEVAGRGNLKLDNMIVPLEIKIPEGEEPKLEYVVQDNQYDIVFLLQLAHRHGYDLVLKYKSEDKKERPYLFFGPTSNETRISYTLEWGKSLIQFQPTLNTFNQVSEVTVRGWNALKKKEIKVTVKRDELDARSLRDKQRLKKVEEGFNEKKELIVDKPFHNENEARQYAKAQLMSIAGNMVTARGSTLGTPDLRAGSRIEIIGLGSIFTGIYTVKSTTHTIGAGGYITEFEARMEEKN